MGAGTRAAQRNDTLVLTLRQHCKIRRGTGAERGLSLSLYKDGERGHVGAFNQRFYLNN